MTQKIKRIEWVDCLKAFACLLVVIGHLMQSFQQSNIDNYKNITIFLNWFIYLFHMPLFMMLSGFLFFKTKKISSIKEYKRFSIKKIINLSIPYIFFYISFIGINMIFSKSVNTSRGFDDLIGIFNNPISPYWFLYALLSIFLFVPIIEKILKYDSKKVFFFFLILKIISILFKTNIYCIDSIMSHGLYFYLGTFIRLENKGSSLKSFLSLFIFFLLALGYYFIYKNININDFINEVFRIFFALFGIKIFVDIFRKHNKCSVLDTFKKYTFQIYLLHTIFAAGIRIILFKLGIYDYAIHFIFGIIFSIYVPIIISKVCEKSTYLNFFFFPMNTIELIKKTKKN